MTNIKERQKLNTKIKLLLPYLQFTEDSTPQNTELYLVILVRRAGLRSLYLVWDGLLEVGLVSVVVMSSLSSATLGLSPGNSHVMIGGNKIYNLRKNINWVQKMKVTFNIIHHQVNISQQAISTTQPKSCYQEENFNKGKN